jgi:hypothetical protein
MDSLGDSVHKATRDLEESDASLMSTYNGSSKQNFKFYFALHFGLRLRSYSMKRVIEFREVLEGGREEWVAYLSASTRIE